MAAECDKSEPSATLDLSDREVRSLRRWCIELAMQGPANRAETREVIQAAQEFEAYVLGRPGVTPAPAA